MAKTIVFCADGTWNGPGQDDDDGNSPNITNVLKLFLSLEGRDTDETVTLQDEQERSYDAGNGVVQIAKYLHGVGDSRNIMVRLMGGAFGAGTITRIVRGYTFVSRNYEDGDRIVLVGFSRGAYTARALAGLIVDKGLLNPTTTDLSDKEAAYRKGAAAWYSHRKSVLESGPWWKGFLDVLSNLPGFVSDDVTPSDFIPGRTVQAVGVWDTVGSCGIPAYALDGTRADVFQFASTTLHDNVKYGFHAVSVDEQRRDFSPTLWSERNSGNITQALFPGAHADVGGGYPTTDWQSGLSDMALAWMKKQLSQNDIGVQFGAPNSSFNPNAQGVAHQPWNDAPWNLPPLNGHQSRTFPDVSACPSLGIHQSVVDRWGQSVPCTSLMTCSIYEPGNIGDLFDGPRCLLQPEKIFA